MKPKNAVNVMLCAMLLSALTACQSSAPRPVPAPMRDEVTALLNHPEFPAAARAAPQFTQNAMETIIRLETEIAAAAK